MAVDETTGQKRGWVSFAQCSHKLADFGLEHAQIDSLVGLMDVDADGRISMVRRAFPSWMRSILTDIYLCRTCSCHEILRMETPGQDEFTAGYRRVVKLQCVQCLTPLASPVPALTHARAHGPQRPPPVLLACVTVVSGCQAVGGRWGRVARFDADFVPS
jgi:hypothetical protein